MPIVLAVAATLSPSPAGAQARDDPTAESGPDSVVVEASGLTGIGTIAEDRIRLHQLLGRRATDGFLLRSASTLTDSFEGRGGRVQALLGTIGSVWNSALPFSGNDGSMWAGRGHNFQVEAGMRFDFWRLSLIAVPRIVYQQNADFQTVPFNRIQDDGRHPFSSPWYDRPESIDMPSRFGAHSFATADLGQSSLSLDLGPVVAGAATENLWWGPGIRNAIIMSNHAAGIPHLFVRTSDGLTTPLGVFEGRWMLGALQESEYFDDNRANGTRSFSGLAVTFSPAFEPGLTVGMARSVYAAARDGDVSARAAFDVFGSVGRPNALPPSDLSREPGADQLFSLFSRWVFPKAGFEAYGEWARYEQPASLRDFLVLPHHSQGYTLGMQWARAIRDSSIVRLQGEVSYLEPSASYSDRYTIGWYTSRPVKQGYTQRGQVIGAGIGPGASSQWLALDFLPDDDAQIGLFAGRIRWDNFAFYRIPLHAFYAHDVSLYAGLRVAYRVGIMDFAAEVSTEGRMNYLYQSPSNDWEEQVAVDIRNHSLRLSVTPRVN